MYEELGENFIVTALCGYILAWFSYNIPGLRKMMKEHKKFTIGVFVMIYILTITGIILSNT